MKRCEYPSQLGRPGNRRPFFAGWLAGLSARALLLTGAASLALLAGHAAATEVGVYKDVTRGFQRSSSLIALPPWHDARSTLVWAFATGHCGDERWGAEGDAIDTEALARANVEQAVRTRQRYVVSTGGALGGFECDSDADLARFVARYDSPWLAGLDFDIERGQPPAQIDALVRVLAALHRQRPTLGLSFTLATHAGSDAQARSLNDTGRAVVDALRRHGLAGHAVINLMVMNYGEADRRWCVPAGRRCDMGRSALRAVRNLQQAFNWPLSRIAVTAMLGENDVAGNVFTPADARVLAKAARRLGLAGVYHWSIDRDQPCPSSEPRVSPACHAMPGVAAGRYGQRLREATSTRPRR